MGRISEAAEGAWNGNFRGMPSGVIEEIAPQTYLYAGFSNVVVRETPGGLFIVDPGAFSNFEEKFRAIREVTAARADTIVFSHGHADHCFGVPLYVAEAVEKGWAAPRVVAHEAILGRFARYRLTRGFNGVINNRQFQSGAGQPYWPGDWWAPDTTYAEKLDLSVGGVEFRLRHARGETDDATWVHVPADRALYTGDLFIWVAPNCGNPQKVQRYARDWALAFREMAACEAELLVPGHGMPIFGAARIRQALEESALYLERLHGETVRLMNRGATLDEIIHTVKPPAELQDRPFLRPMYDEPEFIVRNVWRLYGGWWDGLPSHLKPSPEAEQASVIAELAGGAGSVAARAREAVAAGDLRLACHLADWAWLAAPEDEDVRETRREVYRARAAAESSTMSIGIYASTAAEMGDERPRGAGSLWRYTV